MKVSRRVFSVHSKDERKITEFVQFSDVGSLVSRGLGFYTGLPSSLSYKHPLVYWCIYLSVDVTSLPLSVRVMIFYTTMLSFTMLLPNVSYD